MMVYVLFGGMTATTWVQIIKAVLLLGGATLHGASWCCAQFGFSPEAMFAKAVERPASPKRAGRDHGGPGRQLRQGPDLGDLASAWR